ncbi:hypothetical protein [Cupriavidus oxalaticus]|uniref:Uncharacterized protein n=1 Tax=Cupriavidus oxalaticus TaxID=96344 RepID=A0A375G2W6_9BURK|nr:hypothetical protein [Cupriavidus oxalaticus]QRQ85868.1 hypothetical protein JTE91_21665 [Cupriavidus oxalaticus]QRQ95806.1 hypothetical protein JTE92_20595 [Cupriavidus oxalaticus]WQD84477.1 hypothetical protein U0036_08335 [Cupriavidus oxalaticus]SPC12408.1 conserved hypothetical protein [Cupriavidus oxalaticus]
MAAICGHKRIAMLPLIEERRHLELADRHIAEGRVRIRRQIAVIRRLRVSDFDDTTALELLRVLRAIGLTSRDHRHLVVHNLLDALQHQN